jgi:hypothetical protein
MRWEDPRMTLYFYLVMIILFFAVTFLPLRFIIVLWLIYKLHRGRFYHRRRVRNNEELCKIEFNNFLEDNKLTVANMNEKWEYNLGK